jgi:hypothetical protein
MAVIMGYITVFLYALCILFFLFFLLTCMLDNSSIDNRNKTGYAGNVLPSTVFGALSYSIIIGFIGFFTQTVSEMPDWFLALSNAFTSQDAFVKYISKMIG